MACGTEISMSFCLFLCRCVRPFSGLFVHGGGAKWERTSTNPIKLHLSHALNTTSVDLTVKCLLKMKFRKDLLK
jgi:hypothetical protein